MSSSIEWWKDSFDPRHPGPDWVGIDVAVKWSGRSASTIRLWATKGRVRSMVIRGHAFYLQADIPERVMRGTWEVHPRAKSCRRS